MEKETPCIGCTYFNAHKPCKWCVPYKKWEEQKNELKDK